MNHGTTCKFCKKPITLEIDDEYANLGDPMKLMRFAACNRCADIRVERRKLECKVKFICMMRELDPKIAASKREEHRRVLEKLLKQYANMIARWHFLEGMSWDEECVNLIMDKPGHWFDILATLWKVFKDANPERV